MAEKKQVGFRLPPDQYEEVEEWREELGLSKTDAYRRLVRTGLEAMREEREQNQDLAPGERRFRRFNSLSQQSAHIVTPLVLIAIGSVVPTLFGVGDPTVLVAVGSASIGAAFIAGTLSAVAHLATVVVRCQTEGISIRKQYARLLGIGDAQGTQDDEVTD